MKAFTFLAVVFGISTGAVGAEYLVKLKSVDQKEMKAFEARHGGVVSLVSLEGRVVKWTTATKKNLATLDDAQVEFFEVNRPLTLPKNPSLEQNRAALIQAVKNGKFAAHLDELVYPDNPAIEAAPEPSTQAADPKISESWGIASTSSNKAWDKAPQGKGIVVAVTDSGVDYNHEDLKRSMWRNPNEIADNNKDDDNNGFVDDVVGWDFFANDNKPYDAIVPLLEIILKSGNPGHGTHVAGVIASQRMNGMGTAGVAPEAKIMALRFLNEEGKGSVEAGIKAVDYATANGAHIINASWGGEKDEEDDTLLKEAIQRAEKKGVIFVVAAGNGRMGKGYDNDSDAKPVVPASYDYDNMICVSALDSKDALGAFSNWGAKTCKIGAPGVKILSTIPGNRYQDTILDIGQMKVTWDGTSMASPFVAGAAAVIWSMDPKQTAKEVRQKLMERAMATSALSGKVATGGRMDLGWIQ